MEMFIETDELDDIENSCEKIKKNVEKYGTDETMYSNVLDEIENICDIIWEIKHNNK